MPVLDTMYKIVDMLCEFKLCDDDIVKFEKIIGDKRDILLNKLDIVQKAVDNLLEIN